MFKTATDQETQSTNSLQCMCVYVRACVRACVSIYLSVYLSVCLSVCLPVYIVQSPQISILLSGPQWNSSSVTPECKHCCPFISPLRPPL